MSRFKVGDRATFYKLEWMPEWQKKEYLGRVGIVTEVVHYNKLPDGTTGDMVRIAYTDGSIKNIRAMAKHAMHK